MSFFFNPSPLGSRVLWSVSWAAFCLLMYALVLLIQPEVLELMGVTLGGRTRARMLARVVVAFLMIWGLFRRDRWAWWAATVFTIAGSITGLLGVQYPGRFGHVHLLADTIVAPIGIVAIMMANVLLLLPQTRAAFFQREASDQTRHAP